MYRENSGQADALFQTVELHQHFFPVRLWMYLTASYRLMSRNKAGPRQVQLVCGLRSLVEHITPNSASVEEIQNGFPKLRRTSLSLSSICNLQNSWRLCINMRARQTAMQRWSSESNWSVLPSPQRFQRATGCDNQNTGKASHYGGRNQTIVL